MKKASIWRQVVVMDEKVSVVIAVRGSAPKLASCLNSILKSDYSDFEIIVVDDGLEATSLEILENFRDIVKILRSNNRGPSYARNLAAQNTNSQFLAFTDSDCIVDRNWLGELLQGFYQYPETVACGGRQLLPSDATEFEEKVYLFMKRVGFITDYMNRRKGRIFEVNHNPSCNVMYKRDVFLKEGGFLEGLWPGEDVELDYRLKKKGYKIIFNPKAIVYHYKPQNLKSFSRMMYRYGKVQGELVRKYGIFRRIQIIPLLSMVILLLLSYSLFFKILAYLLLIVGVALFYFFRLEVLGFIFWKAGFWRGIFKKSQY